MKEMLCTMAYLAFVSEFTMWRIIDRERSSDSGSTLSLDR